MELTEQEKHEKEMFWDKAKSAEHYGMYVDLKRKYNDVKCRLEIVEEKLSET